MTPSPESLADIRRRLLVWRMALRSHARRIRAGAFDRSSTADDIEHMANEAADLAVALLAHELDGPPADGPAEVEAAEMEAFDEAKTQPIVPLPPKA